MTYPDSTIHEIDNAVGCHTPETHRVPDNERRPR